MNYKKYFFFCALFLVAACEEEPCISYDNLPEEYSCTLVDFESGCITHAHKPHFEYHDDGSIATQTCYTEEAIPVEKLLLLEENKMVVEIFLYSQLFLKTHAVANNLYLSGGIGGLYLEEGSSADDEYIAMKIKINGKDVGCVHDYDSISKQVIFGDCNTKKIGVGELLGVMK